MTGDAITDIGLSSMLTLLDTYDCEGARLYGLYLCECQAGWCACDNSTGDAFTETFCSRTVAINWLLGKYETERAMEIDAQQ